MSRFSLVPLLLLLALFALPARAAAPHPMDALTADEIANVDALLRGAGKFADGDSFPNLTLQEPEKAAVLRWTAAAAALPRKADVTVKRGAQFFRGTVDLTAGRVERWDELRGVQANILLAEWQLAGDVVRADAGWLAAIRKRGYDSPDGIVCAPLTAGYFGDKSLEGRRLLNVPCFDARGAANNVYGRPIEGLVAVVDLEQRSVVRLIDRGVVPVPAAIPSHDYKAQPKQRAPMKPVLQVSPDGPNFTLDGSMLQWQNWSFHLRFERRLGPVLSLVRYDDDGRQRSVAYQLSASEMFVPYMDPDPTWSFRSYMDIGEYGFGILASPLVAGTDCPAHARFLDATIADDAGKPLTMKNALCVFERNTGDPLWRHYEMFTENYEGRPEVELVVRSAPSVGNYDYLVDYVFSLKGEIDVRVGATGIDAVKAVRTTHMRDRTAAADTLRGTLVAPGLSAIFHDHFLSFRLDLDVDGPANRLVETHITPATLPSDSPRRSLWQVATNKVLREGPVAQAHGDVAYTVVNENVTTALGHHPSLHLMPGHSDVSLLSPQDTPQQRAAFSAHLLWATAYDPAERYAAGDEPNQSRGGDGLPRWVQRKRSIDNQDLVLWYTIGFHHVTRVEDWPVMPVLWHGFKLRPMNFFDHNPSLDVAPGFAPAADRK